ncbi:hypothetical protein M514_11639 [Trichuris suis]|uniref:NIDO domain-containing protein n=1 Tax=Trichuris suis TaxID=68888 RepID=A0A085N3A9_9BILA|nr:hypothetical protein M513_11639 [Trichuris suis]KFD63955.1 hypothetical protein M514_11639 [Trichuris suis]
MKLSRHRVWLDRQSPAEKQKQNTFQLVLATDEVRSYAIFNYAALNWTSSTDAGSLRGRGGYQSSIFTVGVNHTGQLRRRNRNEEAFQVHTG